MSKRVLFLMSDTGGGHRAAAEAIRDALYIKYGKDNIDAELLDVFRESTFPMKYFPEFYPWLINHSKESWGMGYKLTNSKRRAEVLSKTYYAMNAHRLKQMMRERPVDVVVCVHSILARPSLRAFERVFDERPPFVTVVTDLVSTHMFWYDKRADLTMVPTQAAYERGLQCNVPNDKMTLTGLPVNPSFMEGLVGQEKARDALGWQQGTPTVLMVAGGDGMGPLWETARAINDKQMDCQLAVVAGRNKQLKAKMDAAQWNQPTHIYPFVTNMPQLMDGADIIVTKAGPATITEAAIAGLPMILMDAIPGQEEGNVTYVVENDAGEYKTEPQDVADTIQAWLYGGDARLKQLAENARSIANPNAVWEIADIVMEWANHGTIKTPDRNVWERARDLVSIPSLNP